MPLKWLAKLKESTAKITRWKARLAAYEFDIHHTKGKDNVVADTLSRLISNQHELSEQELDDGVASTVDSPQPEVTEQEAHDFLDEWPDEAELPPRELQVENIIINDKKHQIIIVWTEADQIESTVDQWKGMTIVTVRIGRNSSEERMLHILGTLTAAPRTFFIYSKEEEGRDKVGTWYEQHRICHTGRMVWCKNKLESVRDTERQKEIAIKIHQGITNHRGAPIIETEIKRNYYWPGIRKTCLEVVTNCEVCSRAKYDRREDPAREEKTETPDRPWQSVEMDVFTWEKRYYVTFIDRFSKVAGAVKVSRKTAREVAGVITEICSRYGCPEEIRTDQGREFDNELVRREVGRLGIRHHRTTAGHPKSRGTIERFHGTLSEHLRILREQGEAEGLGSVRKAVLAYNMTPHSSTGFSPLEIMVRTRADGPEIQTIKTRLEREKTERTERRNTRKTNVRYEQLRIGQVVYVKNACRRNKENQMYRGPWRVAEKLDRNRIRLEDPQGRRRPATTHISEVKSQPNVRGRRGVLGG